MRSDKTLTTSKLSFVSQHCEISSRAIFKIETYNINIRTEYAIRINTYMHQKPVRLNC